MALHSKVAITNFIYHLSIYKLTFLQSLFIFKVYIQVYSGKFLNQNHQFTATERCLML
jgi:hypothetical protein